MPITMYGADWCGDCRRAKAFFADNNITYDFIDLVDEPDKVDVAAELADGAKRIPVIQWPDGTVLVEPSNEELAIQHARHEAFVVTEDREAGRFELHLTGELLSFADYTVQVGDDGRENVVVPHVETIAQFRGNGYADRLMGGITEQLHASGRTITPRCPFAASYLRERPELADLVA